MNLLRRLTSRSDSLATFGIDDYLAFAFGGNQYPLGVNYTQAGSPQVDIENNLSGYISEVANRDGVVAACVYARSLLLSQLRFKFRNITDGPQAALFGSPGLAVLEGPARAATLTLAEQHVSYAGNAYFYFRDDGTIKVLRPDWVSILIGSNTDPEEPGFALDAEVLGYIWHPNSRGAKQDYGTRILAPSQVAHWMPEPDPLLPVRGQSWVTSVMRDILVDRQATDHLGGFFDNAATPNLVFKMDPSKTPAEIAEFAAQTNQLHAGVDQAYKNLFIGGGADVMVVGTDINKLDYSNLQAGHEARVASRARVPAVILGIREGLKGSALNSGNYSSSRRMWSDGWFTPTADGLCDVLAPHIDKPKGPIELTYDPARIAFLQEDRTDEATIQQAQALTIRQFIDAGFVPATAVEAVRTGDFSKLQHTGLYSVQLQPPRTEPEPDGDDEPDGDENAKGDEPPGPEELPAPAKSPDQTHPAAMPPGRHDQ